MFHGLEPQLIGYISDKKIILGEKLIPTLGENSDYFCNIIFVIL